jgi:hypothetical protein
VADYRDITRSRCKPVRRILIKPSGAGQSYYGTRLPARVEPISAGSDADFVEASVSLRESVQELLPVRLCTPLARRGEFESG